MFEQYAVEAQSLEDFLKRYYKHDRYAGRGAEYAAAVLKSHGADLDKFGHDWIGHHESVTGQVVSWFPGGVENVVKCEACGERGRFVVPGKKCGMCGALHVPSAAPIVPDPIACPIKGDYGLRDGAVTADGDHGLLKWTGRGYSADNDALIDLYECEVCHYATFKVV